METEKPTEKYTVLQIAPVLNIYLEKIDDTSIEMIRKLSEIALDAVAKMQTEAERAIVKSKIAEVLK